MHALRQLLLATWIAAPAGCRVTPNAPAPREAGEFTQGRALVDLDALAELRERADAAPDDLDAQWDAASAHVWASLEGHVELQHATEQLLYRAWLLDPRGDAVPAARVLARYLNMRSSVLDLAAIDLQVELYAAQRERKREHATGRSSVGELSERHFQIDSLHLAATALADYDEGHALRAYAKLAKLERRVARRLDAHPDELDTHTMAGNFALTFAAALPLARERRLARAIDHLAAQQANWRGLSSGARDETVAPNVHSVFALWLAEALLAAGELERARAAYQHVVALPDQADTRPRRQIVALAEQRLANLESHAGDLRLLPAWPAGMSSCVACHSHDATLPTDDRLGSAP